MFKVSRFILLFLFVMLLVFGQGLTTNLFSQNNPQKECRAVWIHSSYFNQEKEKAISEIKNMLDSYTAIGINNLFCFSSMMDQHKKGWDFLNALINEAHKREMKVHSIFCPGNRIKLEGEIKENPQWLIRGMKGEMYPHLNIGDADVRKYFTRKVTEALKYDIDGIHLDYIRFPVNQRFSYDKAACEAFKKEYGYSPIEIKHDCGSMVWCEWIKWNAKHVTSLVREVKDVINNSGKNVALGVDVFPDHETAKVLIGQDWQTWAKEGLVDFICPMLYTNDTKVFRRYVKQAVDAADGKCLVYPGIACKSSHNKNTPDGVVQEVKIARETGAEGVVFFSDYSLNEEFIDKLKSTLLMIR
jgi:uncharacterized lipoprotein YddW (UPF0748 family)